MLLEVSEQFIDGHKALDLGRDGFGQRDVVGVDGAGYPLRGCALNLCRGPTITILGDLWVRGYV